MGGKYSTSKGEPKCIKIELEAFWSKKKNDKNKPLC